MFQKFNIFYPLKKAGSFLLNSQKALSRMIDRVLKTLLLCINLTLFLITLKRHLITGSLAWYEHLRTLYV